ncbi:tRNA sulfurtransferase [Budvicia aquatica]|uniref:tRNA sulfurtransferase n=1 Tax=Budvicia aquatica TaxID=82979 RepID=A0A484ZX27_9GAMM|nr:tRNA sulfurtransferase [Budvicia aquatica]
MHDIFEQTLANFRDQLEGKTFCVRVKRRGKQEFNSQDVERYVGGGLNQHIESAKVKLNHPDVTVNLEIEGDRLIMVQGRYAGLGRFPYRHSGRRSVTDLRWFSIPVFPAIC